MQSLGSLSSRCMHSIHSLFACCSTTTCYLAPEGAKKTTERHNGMALDVYAAGICLWQLVELASPFGDLIGLPSDQWLERIVRPACTVCCAQLLPVQQRELQACSRVR